MLNSKEDFMKNVIVKVTGKHREKGGEWDGIEITTTGSLYDKNGSLFLLYDEVMGEEEGDLSHTRIKIEQDPLGVTIHKNGAVTSVMSFSQGGREKSSYETPYGTFMMEICTKELTFREREDGFLLSILYELEMNYEHLSESRITIEVKELVY